MEAIQRESRGKGLCSLASKVVIDCKIMPISRSIIKLIEMKKAEGGKVILASGCHMSYAKEFGRLFGADEVMATSESINLIGKNKLSSIKDKYGEFDYAGDSTQDIPLWKEAGTAYIINANPITRLFARSARPDAVIIFDESTWERLKNIAKTMRVHQWSKNILLFMPLVASHRFLSIKWNDIVTLYSGFLSFSFLASCVYIMNDVSDFISDRNHWVKKKRPIASGAVSIPFAMFIAVLSFLFAVLLSLKLPNRFKYILAGYFILTFLYTLWLKRVTILDVIVLALLYTVRVFAGAVLIAVSISQWFLVFSLFTFLSLSLVKRCADLLKIKHKSGEAQSGRGYRFNDFYQLSNIGTSSSLIACLVYCLFIISHDISSRYSKPELLWLGLPLLIFFFSRIWFLTSRGEMHHDPVIFVMKDLTSYLIVSIFLAVIYVAI